MKLSAAKIRECAAWVEVNGLYPQRCGASIRQFCDAMGIAFITYQRWQANENFVTAITHAREVFQQNTVHEVVNALVKAARGVDFVKKKDEGRPQVVKEYDPTTGKKIKEYTTEKIVTVKSLRETVYYPPDVNAAKFLLTNMDPENWKNKQDANAAKFLLTNMDPENWKNKQDATTDLNLNFEEPPVIVFRDTSKEAGEE